MWLPLLEKALAKLAGNFELLADGNTLEGFTTLTGCPCESIILEHRLGNSRKDIDTEQIWSKLKAAKEAEYPMGSCCGRLNHNPDSRYLSDRGLIRGRYYSKFRCSHTIYLKGGPEFNKNLI